MGQGPEVLREAIRQAETWVRAGELGLLVEQGWVWSVWKQVEGLSLAMGPAASQQDWGGGAAGAHPSLVPTGCVRGGEMAPLLQFLPL